ncbi:MAG: hypothetical protein NT001_07850 [Candidatus Woesearchaeota archaeon]|nr:hypothetical protein [Candidatus Woesearchaeota archaeon]
MRNNPYIVSVISFISIAFLFMVSAGTAYAVDSINHYAYLSLEGDSNSLYNLTDLSPSSDPSYLCTSDAGDGTGCFSRYMEKGLSLFDVYDDSGNSLGTMTLDGVVFATLNEDGTFSGDNVMMWGNADLNLVYDNVTYNNTYGIVLEYWGPASSAFALLNYPDLNVTQFNVDMTKLISENKIIITGQNDTVVQSLEDSRDYEINVDGLGEIGFLNVTESLESALTDKPDLNMHGARHGRTPHQINFIG